VRCAIPVINMGPKETSTTAVGHTPPHTREGVGATNILGDTWCNESVNVWVFTSGSTHDSGLGLLGRPPTVGATTVGALAILAGAGEGATGDGERGSSQPAGTSSTSRRRGRMGIGPNRPPVLDSTGASTLVSAEWCDDGPIVVGGAAMACKDCSRGSDCVRSWRVLPPPQPKDRSVSGSTRRGFRVTGNAACCQLWGRGRLAAMGSKWTCGLGTAHAGDNDNARSSDVPEAAEALERWRRRTRPDEEEEEVVDDDDEMSCNKPVVWWAPMPMAPGATPKELSSEARPAPRGWSGCGSGRSLRALGRRREGEPAGGAATRLVRALDDWWYATEALLRRGGEGSGASWLGEGAEKSGLGDGRNASAALVSDVTGATTSGEEKGRPLGCGLHDRERWRRPERRDGGRALDLANGSAVTDTDDSAVCAMLTEAPQQKGCEANTQ